MCLKATFSGTTNYDLANSHVLPALMRKVAEAKASNQNKIVVWGSGTPRRRILRQLMTGAMLLAVDGGAFGVFSGMRLLHRLSTWHPFAGAPFISRSRWISVSM
jgi:hypothetical protein